MTVKELIEKLKQFDDDMPVYIEDLDGAYLEALKLDCVFDAGLDIALIRIME